MYLDIFKIMNMKAQTNYHQVAQYFGNVKLIPYPLPFPINFQFDRATK